jgi:hypothetical protein
MLQNGIPGHALLIESKDLREVDRGGEGHFCRVFDTADPRNFDERGSVTVYSNRTSLALSTRCATITSIDLSRIIRASEIHENFLAGCTGLSPLSQVTEIRGNFLGACTGPCRGVGLNSVEPFLKSILLKRVIELKGIVHGYFLIEPNRQGR